MNTSHNLVDLYTGCGRNNSHILKGNKNQKKEGTKKFFYLYKAHMMPLFKHF